MKISQSQMAALAQMISQFLKDNDCNESVMLFLLHDFKEDTTLFSGTMSYMSTVPAEAAASIMRFQAERLESGATGEMMLVSTSKRSGGDEVH